MGHVGNIFVIHNNIKQINKFETKLELKFTTKHSTNNKLLFIDLIIRKYNTKIHTHMPMLKLVF